MAKSSKKPTKGSKRLVTFGAEDALELNFKEMIMKGATIDLKEAAEYDNYSEFAMFIKESLEKGKFTMIEFLEALFEDEAEYEYEQYKEEYSEQNGDSFANFIQDDHGPYSAAMVCETDDTIYLVMVDDCDEVSSYFNMLKELALAITNAGLKATTSDFNRLVAEKAKETIRGLHTTNEHPTADNKTVNLDDILSKSYLAPGGISSDAGMTMPTKLATLSTSSVKVLSEPMFKKL
jgi:hypothetical protein